MNEACTQARETEAHHAQRLLAVEGDSDVPRRQERHRQIGQWVNIGRYRVARAGYLIASASRSNAFDMAANASGDRGVQSSPSEKLLPPPGTQLGCDQVVVVALAGP